MEKKKLGRPRNAIPRNKKLTLQLTEDEYNKIMSCAKQYGLTRTDMIIKAVDLLLAQ